MENKPFHEGGCLCGRVRFRIQADPIWAGFCHCSSCRKATGAPAVMYVGFEPRQVVFTKGKPKHYSSSSGVLRGFCEGCGTPISYQSDRFADYIQLYIGTFDRPNAIQPKAHVHVGEKIEWYEVDDDLPRFKASAAAGNDNWSSN